MKIIKNRKTEPKNGSHERTVHTAADLLYYTMVLLEEAGVKPEEIERELVERRIKNK